MGSALAESAICAGYQRKLLTARGWIEARPPAVASTAAPRVPRSQAAVTDGFLVWTVLVIELNLWRFDYLTAR
jgi:hypothetical protein